MHEASRLHLALVVNTVKPYHLGEGGRGGVLHYVRYTSVCQCVAEGGEREGVCVCACMRVCIMFNANVSTCKLHVLKMCELECG